jgi:hypothetical protein
MSTLSKEIRYSEDISMFTLDRPIPTSCVHKTEYCDATCYNNKLYKLYPAMHTKDIRNEQAWIANDAEDLAKSLKRKRTKQTKRIRLMSRGEAFSTIADVQRVANLLDAMPDSVFWIPTRSWRNPVLFAMVQTMASKRKNARVLASMDPSNTSEEWEHVRNIGASTMFYGNDAMLETPNGERMFKCPKTHAHLKGHCEICKAGCFNAKKRVNVHLKQH